MTQNEIMQLASNADAMSLLEQIANCQRKLCELETEQASVKKNLTELYLEIIECLDK